MMLFLCCKIRQLSISPLPSDNYKSLEEIEQEIKSLTRPIIAGLRSYTSPPAPVHRTLIAVYLLLGENHKELKEWNKILSLLNHNSLVSRIEGCKERGSEMLVTEARKVIKGMTDIEVYTADSSVYCLFEWVTKICGPQLEETASNSQKIT